MTIVVVGAHNYLMSHRAVGFAVICSGRQKLLTPPPGKLLQVNMQLPKSKALDRKEVVKFSTFFLDNFWVASAPI